MFDPASIVAALTSAKNILDLAKNANDAHLAMKISSEVANVQGRLIDVQQQTMVLQAENQELRVEIEKARSYVHHHSVTWKIRSDAKEDGPFCPTCIGEGREMRLILWEQADQSRAYWLTYCPKGHIDHRAKPQGWIPAKQEPTYAIPKELLPENYFFYRGRG